MPSATTSRQSCVVALLRFGSNAIDAEPTEPDRFALWVQCSTAEPSAMSACLSQVRLIAVGFPRGSSVTAYGGVLPRVPEGNPRLPSGTSLRSMSPELSRSNACT